MLDGYWLNIVKPLGWLILGLIVAGGVCLYVYVSGYLQLVRRPGISCGLCGMRANHVQVATETAHIGTVAVRATDDRVAESG